MYFICIFKSNFKEMERKINLIRDVFLSQNNSKYYLLADIFSKEEIFEKPYNYLYKETLSLLELNEEELPFSSFSSGLKRLRIKIKNKNIFYKNIKQGSPSLSTPAPQVKNNKKPENNWIDDFMKKNPPPPSENNKPIDDLIIPIY